MDRLFNRWLTALDDDTDPGAPVGTVSGSYGYPHADSETTVMDLGDQLLCDPAPASQPSTAAQQQAALGSSAVGLIATTTATVDATGTICAESPMIKKNPKPSECSSPVVSPCLSPSASGPMSDGIEYLDLNDSEMDKWPGVDPESRYQSALNYTVM